MLYTQLDLDWKINISCNSILCFNLQLMRQSRYDMNLKIFGVNFSQFSMDLPTANIIKSPRAHITVSVCLLESFINYTLNKFNFFKTMI